jgi:protein-S-isoprenylcysteine O-methyltransferase Ste14
MSSTAVIHTVVDRRRLGRRGAVRAFSALVLLGLMFFLSAGTIGYWEAWVYLGLLAGGTSLAFLRLYRTDLELLERRMRLREKEPVQRRIMALSTPLFLIVLLLPGFDERFGWSHVPAPAVVAADLLVLAAYYAFLLVLKENRYASRIIEIDQGQTVVTTGPYRIVRHPMYAAVLVLYLATPIALGSLWALAPMLLVVPVIVARLLDEERLLRSGLEGYSAYMARTRARLIPGVW